MKIKVNMLVIRINVRRKSKYTLFIDMHKDIKGLKVNGQKASIEHISQKKVGMSVLLSHQKESQGKKKKKEGEELLVKNKVITK